MSDQLIIPMDVNLSEFAWMPIHIKRLRDSKAWLKCKRRPELAFYMINLWTSAWHEVPAASLEDDDDVLADRAMCERSKWDKVRGDVLRGWVKHGGRIYHPVVAAKALESWLEKLSAKRSGASGNAKRWMSSVDQTEINAKIEEARKCLIALDPSSPVLSRVRVSAIATVSHSDPPPTGPLSQKTGPDQTGPDQTGQGHSEDAAQADGAEAPPPKAKRGTRLPAEFNLPRRWGEHAVETYGWSDAAIREEADKFRDYWLSKSGKDATKVDWFAAWRYWCSNARRPRNATPQTDAEFVEQVRQQVFGDDQGVIDV